MRKFYLITYAFVACIFLAAHVYAQAPAFTYPATLTLTTGKSITPVKPTHTGGALPKEIYSRASTIAGTGAYGRKDTVAAFATFTNPVSAAADRNGVIYVADANSNCIRKIANGVVTTFAGSINGESGGKNGKDTTARFNYPTGVAVDHDGNVYVADYGNSLIRKITPSGFVSTLAGNQNSGSADGNGTDASFSYPYALTVSPGNQLWVADTYSHKIRQVSFNGDVKTFTGTGAIGFHNGSWYPAAGGATYNTPKGLVVDRHFNFYITEEGNNAVRKIDASNNLTVTTFSIGKFKKPIGVAVDSLDNVYISSEEKYNIYKFTPDGKLVDSLQYPSFSGGALKGYANGTDTLAKYRGNMGLFYDGKDNLIVTDPGSDYIRKVAINGYSVYPRLPEGLTLNEDGSITGTPTKVTSAQTYKITAHNIKGVGSFNISIGITKGRQVITFNAIKPVTYGDKDFAPVATSNSSAAITYKSDNAKIATIIDNKVHVVGAGTVNIIANQAANNDYAAALPDTQKLTVNKAKLSAAVYHYYKVQGKDNPSFTIYYFGFFHGDTTSAIKVLPVANTTAIKDSPEGDYPITLTGGSSTNYDFVYTAGTLTVFPEPKIAATGSTNIAKGDSVLLTAAVSVAGAYTYQWFFNGSKISGATKAAYYAKQSGAYTVAITKDTFTATSQYMPVNVQLLLPADNFSVKVNSVSCKGDNNGSIVITAAQKLSYVATVLGNGYNNKQFSFTDILTLDKLSPGNYSVCISVENELFNQCYQLVVTEPKDLSVYSTIDKSSNALTIQLDGGSAYNINLNDAVYTTTKSEITLPLKAGINKLVITTDKLCQGVIEKTIDMSGITMPYPNPFTGVLNVNIGSSVVKDVKVNVVNVLSGKSVHTDQLSNRSGVLQFDLSGIADGIYYFNLKLDNTKLGYKIIKK